MWSLLKMLLARFAIVRLLLKALGSFGWLLPLALLLKTLGWPVIVVMLVLAIPLFIVLAVIGLPLLAVAVVGGFMLMVVFWLMSMALLLLKIAIPVMLVLWLLRWLWGSNGHHRPGGDDAGGAPDEAEVHTSPPGSAGDTPHPAGGTL